MISMILQRIMLSRQFYGMNQLCLCILQLLGVMDHPLNQYPSWYCMILFGEMAFYEDFNQQFDYCTMDSSTFMAISALLTVYLYCWSEEIEMTQFGLTIDEKFNEFHQKMILVLIINLLISRCLFDDSVNKFDSFIIYYVYLICCDWLDIAEHRYPLRNWVNWRKWQWNNDGFH